MVVASVIIGLIFGIISAFISHKVKSLKESPSKELFLLLFIAYLSNAISEYINASGTISAFICGILMNHYTYYNMSEKCQYSSTTAVEFISEGAEAFLFLYLGIALFNIQFS